MPHVTSPHTVVKCDAFKLFVLSAMAEKGRA